MNTVCIYILAQIDWLKELDEISSITILYYSSSNNGKLHIASLFRSFPHGRHQYLDDNTEIYRSLFA